MKLKIYNNRHEVFLDPYYKILSKYKMICSLSVYLERSIFLVNNIPIHFDEEDTMLGKQIIVSIIYDKDNDIGRCFKLISTYIKYFWDFNGYTDYTLYSIHVSDPHRRTTIRKKIPIHWSIKNNKNRNMIINRLIFIGGDDSYCHI